MKITCRNLETQKGLVLSYLNKNTIKVQIQNIQVDFITHAYPLTKELLVIENIRFASLEDIAAMKLNAIVGNGTRLKDFVDIAHLSAYLSLNEMVRAYYEKYRTRNPLIIVKALSFHDDINFAEPLHMITGSYKWQLIERRINQMINFPDKILQLIS